MISRVIISAPVLVPWSWILFLLALVLLVWPTTPWWGRLVALVIITGSLWTVLVTADLMQVACRAVWKGGKEGAKQYQVETIQALHRWFTVHVYNYHKYDARV